LQEGLLIGTIEEKQFQFISDSNEAGVKKEAIISKYNVKEFLGFSPYPTALGHSISAMGKSMKIL